MRPLTAQLRAIGDEGYGRAEKAQKVEEEEAPVTVTDTEHELEQAGVSDRVTVTLADAGFRNTEHLQTLSGHGIRTLVSPNNWRRHKPGNTKVDQQHDIQMREQLATEDGRALYPKRKSMIEPVFGQIERNRRVDRFTRRG